MSLRKFEKKDLIYNTLVANPEYEFIVQNKKVYKNDEILDSGDFSNKIKHVADGEQSLYEMNVNRPADSLIYGFITKQTTRLAQRSVSTSEFDSSNQFNYGDVLKINYPLKAGLSRIYIPAGIEQDDHTFANMDNPSVAHVNKKYIRAIRNVLDSREELGKQVSYGNLGTQNINIICVPGIFYGSKLHPKSVELNHYVQGSLIAQAKDSNGDGVLYQTSGLSSGTPVGYVIYEQGLIVLFANHALSTTYQDNFFDTTTTEAPTWLSYGTGIPENSEATQGSSVTNSLYQIKFSGTNKIPTLTMLAFSPRGMETFSTNDSFLELSTNSSEIGDMYYRGEKRKIKNITHSDIPNYNAHFQNTTFISKIGIFDENKKLIAVATLANPVKKTLDREFMFKMRMDF